VARKTIVTLIDDMTGETIEDGSGQTVAFSVAGSDYEIDLSAPNARELLDAFGPYIEAGRKVGTSRRSPIHRTPVVTGVDNRAVRAWAASRGIRVSPRGRIPADVIDQYRAAGN
jgi:hypothetical protein